MANATLADYSHQSMAAGRIIRRLLAPIGIACLLLAIGSIGPAVYATDRCVHPIGAGGCFTTIQAAVTAAADDDTINIAAGTYNENVIVGSKRLTFIGAGADSTFVDGSNTGRVFSVTATSAVFADLTIQNGWISGTSTTGLGGGLYVSGTLTLTNVNVLSNTVTGTSPNGGGGVRVRGPLYVTGGRFENNYVLITGAGEGGAILSNALSAPHPNAYISGTVFISNTAAIGGGVSVAGAAWLTNTQFISNTANGTISNQHGGGFFNSDGMAVTVSGSRFERNWAKKRGGGLYNSGPVVVTDTVFISNTAATEYGGGLAGLGTVNISGGSFEANTAGTYGGGLRANGAAPVSGASFISNTAGYNGGGLFNNTASALTSITGARFYSNTAMDGGGAYASGPLAMTNTQITTNTATRSGGGVYVNNGNLSITGSQFISNTSAASGGGVTKNSLGNQVYITDTQFIANTAGVNVVGTYTGNGGGIYSGDDLHALNVTFTGNASNWITTTDYLAGGGGIFGGRLLELSGVRFENNSAATSGGGLHSAGSSVTYTTILTDVQFINNTAAQTGGGVYARGLKALSNGMFSGNTAGYGGGLYLLGNSAGQHSLVNSVFAANTAISETGAAMYLFGSATYAGVITILHTTVASPTPGAGSAIFVGTSPSKVIQANITDTIVANYAIGIAATNPLSVTSDYNLFYNAPTAIDIGGHSLTGLDPLFVDPANGDYHLGADSAAVDAGVDAGVTTDYDEDTRPQGRGYDIGYDELLQRCVPSLSTGVDYTFGSPAVTLNFSNLGTINCVAGVYLPRAQPHATGTVGHGVGGDHFWQIAARAEGGAAATDFTALLTAPTGGASDPKLCFYSGEGVYGWDCAGTVSGGNISRTTTHFSDWAVGNQVGPNALTVRELAARRTSFGGGLAVLGAALAALLGGLVWLTAKRRRGRG